MRGLTRKSASTLVLLTLLLSFASPIQSQAVNTFRSAPSTVWGHIYAGPSTDATQTRPPKVANLEQKSKFVVNYKNFPEWAKRDFQAAVDIWSANFASRVPITIDATWSRSSSSGILGSARPGNFYAGFDGAPDPSLCPFAGKSRSRVTATGQDILSERVR